MFNVQSTKKSIRGVWENGLNTSLTAYWRLDENAGTRYDSVSVNNLAPTNSPDSLRGKVRNAANFVSASSQYLSIADNTALSIGDVSATFAFWVRFNSLSADTDIISKDNEVAGQREYFVGYSSSSQRLRFFVFSTDGGSFTQVLANNLGVPSTGVWYFVVAWHDADADTINIQVNNGTADSTAWTLGIRDSTTSFNVGRRPVGAGANFLNGAVDEIGFWKRVLTADERALLWNNGLGTPKPY